MIFINNGRLDEIHQADLKPFPLLEILDLAHNDIEHIEFDLFDFNPNLKEIWFTDKIKHVDVGTFDNLNNLVYLHLYNEPCIYREAKNDNNALKNLIETAEDNCYVHSIDKIRQKKFQGTLKWLEYSLKEATSDSKLNLHATQNAGMEISDLSHKFDDCAEKVKEKLKNLTVTLDEFRKSLKDIKSENKTRNQPEIKNYLYIGQALIVVALASATFLVLLVVCQLWMSKIILDFASVNDCNCIINPNSTQVAK